MTPKIKNLITRTITGVLFVAIMVTCFLRPVGMVFVFALITSLSLWEYTGLVNENKGTSVNRFISTVAGTYFFLAVAGVNSGFIATNAVFVPYLLTIVYLFVSELYTKAKDPINNWAYTMFGQMYIALPLSMINVLAFRQADNQIYFYYLLPLSVFIFLWTNDTGAYCSGSLFGKHKLFPRVSPAKSWEGSIGGGILVLLVAVLIGYLESQSDAPINLTIPAGRCAQIKSSQSPAEQEEAGQIAALILLIPGMNQRLPLTEDNLTLQRVRFDLPTRTMHKCLTLNDSTLAKQPAAQIRTKLQAEARTLVCDDPLLAQSNRYYPTTHHFTLPGQSETFEATVAKNSCAGNAK